MTDTPNNDNRTVAVLKPQYLLGVAIIGLALTIIGGFQPRFGIMGFAGLGILGLSIVTWGIIAPEQLRAALVGRTTRYGGTAFVVTVVLIVALIALYALFRGLNMTFDVTQRDAYSLRPEVRDALAGVVGNPDTPELRLITFLTAEDAGLQDRLTLLYEDIESTTLGKISYDFVDIDLQPLLAEQYGVLQSQQIAVTPLDEAGDPLPAQANLIEVIDTSTLQIEIVEFAVAQNLQGQFATYVVVENGGVRIDTTDGSGMTFLSDDLRTVFGYQVVQGTLAQYRTSEDIVLNDPELDGELMMVVGGSFPLADEDREFLQEYLTNGGNLILMPGLNFEGEPNLAADPELSDFLLENYGIAFNDDFVVDPLRNYEGSQIELLPNSINPQSFIGQMGVGEDFDVQFLFGFPSSSVQIAETPPDNVNVIPLIPTSPEAYAIPNSELPTFIQTASAPDPSQAVREGQLMLAATSENQDTGSRVVLIGSATVAQDVLTDNAISAQFDIDNRTLMLRSILWASRFNDSVASIDQSFDVPELEQNLALIATEEQISQMNLILGFVLPFAVLGLGVLVVFANREREDE